MPFTNIKADHLSAAQKTAVLDFITSLENALPNLPTLTPEERKRYGSVNETNKLFVNKVKDQHTMQPGMSSVDVDWDEFGRDYESRAFYEAVQSRLLKLVGGIDNSKILHDFDNYQDALDEYGYAQYRYGRGVTGYENKVNELKQFFARTPKPANTPPVQP